jgi:hypothetical protein
MQQLLAEAGQSGLGHALVAVEARGAEAAAEWDSVQSPETYVGYARTEHFASPGGTVGDQRRVYTAPAQLPRNHWALTGEWTVGKQAAVLHTANGRIVYRFHARDLHLVMGPATRGTSVRLRVRLDDQPPGAAHGMDVDDQGHGTVTAPRLSQLIRQPSPITGAPVRDRIARSGCGSVCVDVWLIHGGDARLDGQGPCDGVSAMRGPCPLSSCSYDPVGPTRHGRVSGHRAALIVHRVRPQGVRV